RTATAPHPRRPPPPPPPPPREPTPPPPPATIRHAATAPTATMVRLARSAKPIRTTAEANTSANAARASQRALMILPPSLPAISAPTLHAPLCTWDHPPGVHHRSSTRPAPVTPPSRTRSHRVRCPM